MIGIGFIFSSFLLPIFPIVSSVSIFIGTFLSQIAVIFVSLRLFGSVSSLSILVSVFFFPSSLTLIGLSFSYFTVIYFLFISSLSIFICLFFSQ